MRVLVLVFVCDVSVCAGGGGTVVNITICTPATLFSSAHCPHLHTNDTVPLPSYLQSILEYPGVVMCEYPPLATAREPHA